MADRTLEGLNNQKRTASISVSDTIATSATLNDTLFNLPKNSMVVGGYVLVTTASGTSTDTVDVKVGSTVVINEAVVGATGVQEGTLTKSYFSTGGAVTVVAGSDAPDDAGRIRVVLEYIELDKVNGEYTEV